MTVDADRATFCLDADVLIFAAAPDHAIGEQIRRLFRATDRFRLCGSTLLFPEVLIKPVLQNTTTETELLTEYLAQLEILPITETVGKLAVFLGANYGLDAMDATHLATAVDGGADVFLTNNHRDFDQTQIAEVDVMYPRDLPEP